MAEHLLTFVRLRQQPTQARTTAEGGLATDGQEPSPGGDRTGKRLVAARVTTALAGLLVLFALVAPNEISRLTPGAFVRIPVEGLVAVPLLLLLPAGARRVVAALAGAALGLLTVVKIVDMGFYAALARPFDPVLDWTFFGPGVEFLTSSIGRVGAIGCVVAAVVLGLGVIVLMTLSVLRLTRLVVRHNSTATRTVAVLGVAWITCAVLGVQIAADVPVASRSAASLAYHRALQVNASLHDQRAFAAQSAVDPFRDTPGTGLLAGLRGKDVVLAFVESYGRNAVEDPELARQVGGVLDAGTRRLRAAGFTSRSAFLTSSTVGGGSWLAHGTLLSGLWVNNQQRYRNLVSGDRLTLNGAFRRAGWRTVAVMPGATRDWPEGAFFGYDRIYAEQDLGYRGPHFNLPNTMPDQYTLAAFQRLERAKPDHAPVMAEIPLVTSHAPWTPVPRLVDWSALGDGSVFDAMAGSGDPPGPAWRDPTRLRANYRSSIAYSLGSLVSYVEKYGDDDLVLVFLGDHQPAPIVTGAGAGRDVPITIVARDRTVLDRISGWGWQDGLKPGRQAPVWRMDMFRDRFLTAFGPQAQPSRPPAR